ncbi:MAG: PAS domain-containing protein [Gemmatimonadetes bacterium]|nr:PAS domain-containing protein [Gemmatimonadota bacterium]
MEDITERREAEEQLRVREERLALALAFTGTGIWEWDIGTDRMYWSPEVMALLGNATLTPSFATFQSLVHPDDLPLTQRLMEQALAERREFRARFRMLRPDGMVRWVEDIARASYDAEGRPMRLIGTVRDVTAEQEATLALERSEQRFRELAEALPAIVWTADPAGHFDFVSPQWTAYSGEDPVLGTSGGWLAHVHPDDLAAMVAVIERAVATLQDVHHEVRLKGRNGAYRWFEIRATMRRDAAGQPLKWNGTVVDVDDAHHTREALAARDVQLTELGATAPGVMFTFRTALPCRSPAPAWRRSSGCGPSA